LEGQNSSHHAQQQSRQQQQQQQHMGGIDGAFLNARNVDLNSWEGCAQKPLRAAAAAAATPQTQLQKFE
jgi:hypothetical protein